QRPANAREALALLDTKHEPPPDPSKETKRPAVSRTGRRWVLLIAVVLGVFVGGAARFTLAHPPRRPAIKAQAARPFARVEGQKGDYPTLELALANAKPGAVITLHGDGVFRADAFQATSLTLRAAPGSRPIVEAGGDGWEPMLSAQSLTL